MHILTGVAGSAAFVTAAATAIGGIAALLGSSERTTITSSDVVALPDELLSASWFFAVAVVVAVAAWFALAGVNILRRRRWIRPWAVATFIVGALVALVIAVDVDPAKAEGVVDPVAGAGVPAYAVSALNAAGAVLLLLPPVRADFTEAWLDRHGPERRAQLEARRNYRW